MVQSRPRRVFYGWWIVLAFVVINTYWAGTLISGLTVFFTPVRQSFGWSAALLASIFSITNLATGLAAPLIGVWFDRFGPRALMLAATACAGAGLLALSRATSLLGFVAAFSLLSAGFAVWQSGVGVATGGQWFVRRRGLATGVILAGVPLGGLLVPVWAELVERAGWRNAFVGAGLALWAITLPACLVLRHRPADLGLLPDGDGALPAAGDRPAGVGSAGGTATGASGEHTPNRPPPLIASPENGPHAISSAAPRADWARPARQPAPGPPPASAGIPMDLGVALKSRRFWVLSVVSSVVLGGSTAAGVLMLPRLEESGLDAGVAVAAVTAVTLLGAVGRLGSGALADRFDPVTLAAASFLLQAAGLLAFALAPRQLPVLALFVVAFGLSGDNIRVLATVMLARAYGPRLLGRVQGAHFAVLVPGRVLAPVLAGSLHDRGHGYAPAFTVFALVTLLSILPLRLLRGTP